MNEVRASGSQPLQELIVAMPLLVGAPLTLDYGPRGSERRSFQGTLRADGVEVDGKVLSSSYAAVYCMQEAGSPRKTANGWKIRRVNGRELLDDLYNRIRSNATQVDAGQQ